MPRLFTPRRLLARALARDDSENLVGKHGHLFEKSRPRNELASVSGGSSARRECRVHNCAAAVASRAAMAHFPRPICSGAIMRLHMAMRTCAAHAALSYPFFLFLDPLAYLSILRLFFSGACAITERHVWRWREMLASSGHCAALWLSAVVKGRTRRRQVKKNWLNKCHQ